MELINQDEHVGKQLLALDFRCGCSPAFEAIIDPRLTPEVLAKKLRDKLEDAVKEVIGEQYKWVVPFEIIVHGRTGIIKSREERKAKFEQNLREVQEVFTEAHEERVRRLKEHPDNGKLGYWQVDGIRHNAIVKASNAEEAVEKAKEIVGSWESPDACFLGEELPDVIAV